jgi:hypothetical protein
VSRRRRRTIASILSSCEDNNENLDSNKTPNEVDFNIFKELAFKFKLFSPSNRKIQLLAHRPPFIRRSIANILCSSENKHEKVTPTRTSLSPKEVKFILLKPNLKDK